jgi:hypothetical protein
VIKTELLFQLLVGLLANPSCLEATLRRECASQRARLSLRRDSPERLADDLLIYGASKPSLPDTPAWSLGGAESDERNNHRGTKTETIQENRRVYDLNSRYSKDYITDIAGARNYLTA